MTLVEHREDSEESEAGGPEWPAAPHAFGLDDHPVRERPVLSHHSREASDTWA